jgi:hypothetical protein
MVATAGDFDGDNEPDAFTVTPSGELLLWRGRGGEFRAPKVVGAGWSGMNLITGGTDVDGDGYPDVIARDHSGNQFLYAGDGAGGWKASSLIGIGWGAMSMVFSPGDFTGDGVADVLARDGSGRLWRYAGNRAGMLGGAAQVGVGWDSMQALAASDRGSRFFSRRSGRRCFTGGGWLRGSGRFRCGRCLRCNNAGNFHSDGGGSDWRSTGREHEAGKHHQTEKGEQQLTHDLLLL